MFLAPPPTTLSSVRSLTPRALIRMAPASREYVTPSRAARYISPGLPKNPCLKPMSAPDAFGTKD